LNFAGFMGVWGGHFGPERDQVSTVSPATPR
jgi:hypothetical protein